MKITEFKEQYKKCFPVERGWKKLVLKLVDDLIKIDKNIEVLQVKEKFGGLRFYIGAGINKEAYDLINKAEEESYKICEDCGETRNVTTESIKGIGYIRTLCCNCRRLENERHSW
jgi:hypothetical protein